MLGNFFFICKVRLRKFILKNQRDLLDYSFLGVLLGFLGITIHLVFFRSSAPETLRFTIQSAWMLGFFGIALLNFLIAYTLVTQKEGKLQDLKKLVLIDPLTELYNKGYFLSKLQNEVVRSKRYNHILSLILIDIDHFKRLNDTYGHICGDKVLRKISEMLKTEIRLVDMACRFGGEEFAVICPETSPHEAYMIAERIRKKIEATEFQYQKEKIAITISAGIHKFDPIAPVENHLLFKGADQALYHAKSSGRNRVIIFSPKYKNFPSNMPAGKSAPKKRDIESKKSA